MNRNTPYKFIFPAALVMIFVVLILVISYYNKIYGKNINTGNVESTFFYIHTGSGYNDFTDSLLSRKLLINEASFLWLAKKKNLKNHIYPGKYIIKNGMSNNELINKFRSGKQEPVKVIFNNIRTNQQLAGIVSRYLEADSTEISDILNDNVFLESYGFTVDNVMTVFIPNTYELYWNTSAKGFFEKMLKENDRFWNKNRLIKASEIPLDRKEVSILASIVEKETNHHAEMPEIAGVYINRLKTGMPLQADPTIIFALGDFTKKRVLKEDTKIDSPYNTYKYSGLPPGPICLPEPSTIDHVLNYKQHNYFYFCARDDMSGYHNFAGTLKEHLKNARNYQRALNKLKIKK